MGKRFRKFEIFGFCLLLTLAACGNGDNPSTPPESPGSGTDSPAEGTPPADWGENARPFISAVRNGKGWKIGVTLAVETNAQSFIQQIKLEDGAGEVLGQTTFEAPSAREIPNGVLATFSLATEELPEIRAVVVDNQGRSWYRRKSLK